MKTAQLIAQQQSENSLQTEGKAEKPKARVRRGTHPNSLANLKPFEPGVSGNPSGRPRDEAAAFARHTLANTFELWLEGFARRAATGDAYAFSVLADRGFGKLKQGIIHTGDEEGGPVKASITVEFLKPEDVK